MLSARRQDAFGVELHADMWLLAVAHAHHDLALVLGAGGLDEFVGEVLALDAERVVPADAEPIGEPREHALAVVGDRRRLPVDDLGRVAHPAPATRAQRLVAETDAEHGAVQREGVDRDPGLCGVPGPGDDDAVVGSSARIPARSTASLRRTATAPATSPTYWTRLYANES